MLLDVRHVYVIQQKSTGLFLTPNLYYSRGLKLAGRCTDYESARDTALSELGFDDFIISDFYERVD